MDLRSSVRLETCLAPSPLNRCTAWKSWNTHRSVGFWVGLPVWLRILAPDSPSALRRECSPRVAWRAFFNTLRRFCYGPYSLQQRGIVSIHRTAERSSLLGNSATFRQKWARDFTPARLHHSFIR